MDLPLRNRRLAVVLLVVAAASSARATEPDAASQSMRQFLEHNGAVPAYRALRRLEAQTGHRRGWLEAETEYSPGTGFRYAIVREGGSRYIRSKVLKALLNGERDVIARGETARSALHPSNYNFQPDGIDSEGLAHVLLTPRRRERMLVSGMMALQADDGTLVRLQGRLARNPSFWIRSVDIVRRYERIDGVVMPVALESTAQVRFLGAATLQMTYDYSEIDGRPVTPVAPARLRARQSR